MSLAEWIRELETHNKMYVFYKCKAWISVRDKVLKDAHYECQKCKRRGRYTRATMVHHINHVKDRPDLALSRTYIDEDGNEQVNLEALCDACHEEEHDRFTAGKKKEPSFMNEERW